MDKNILLEIKTVSDKLESVEKTKLQLCIDLGFKYSELKKSCKRGEFSKYIKTVSTISLSTANKYIRLYSYQDKLENSSSLSDANKIVTMYEKGKKADKRTKAKRLIKEFEITGKKSDEWDRSCTYYFNKKNKRQKVVDEIEDNINKEREHRIEQDIEDINLINNLNKKLSFVGDLNGGSVVAIVDNLISQQDDNNRQLELLHNMIKYCKSCAIQLQVA